MVGKTSGLTPFIREYAGKSPRIHRTARIAPGAIIIGDVIIGPQSNIWYGCIIRGDVNQIEIGDNCNIQDGTVIHGQTFGERTIIGHNISIGHQALLHACILRDNCFIGMKACVMNNSIIDEYCLVGAGSVVGNNKIFAPHSLIIGNPAKTLRPINDSDKKMMDWTAPHYISLAENQLQTAMEWGIANE